MQKGSLNDVNKLGLPPKIANLLKDRLLSNHQQTPSKRQKLNDTDLMKFDSLETNPAFLVELSENIKEQLMRIAWSHSLSSQI